MGKVGRIAYALMMGLVGFYVRYFAVLAITPLALLLMLGFLVAGAAMIFVIPGSILMLIFGDHAHHASAVRGIFMGLEWMFFGFVSGLAGIGLKEGWKRMSKRLDHASRNPPKWMTEIGQKPKKPAKPLLMLEYKPASVLGVNHSASN